MGKVGPVCPYITAPRKDKTWPRGVTAQSAQAPLEAATRLEFEWGLVPQSPIHLGILFKTDLRASCLGGRSFEKTIFLLLFLRIMEDEVKIETFVSIKANKCAEKAGRPHFISGMPRGGWFKSL